MIPRTIEKCFARFSATLNTEIRGVCKKFMQEPHEIFVDDEAKLTLHGLLQYYCKLSESEKNRKVNDLLDSLEFNQVLFFFRILTRRNFAQAFGTTKRKFERCMHAWIQ